MLSFLIYWHKIFKVKLSLLLVPLLETKLTLKVAALLSIVTSYVKNSAIPHTFGGSFLVLKKKANFLKKLLD